MGAVNAMDASGFLRRVLAIEVIFSNGSARESGARNSSKLARIRGKFKEEAWTKKDGV